ncbi:XRE family transcriptional regulator [Deinococcus irradiatisoli]|uniref:XRE family transcriptional regulator n=1 Tax=Deinococcus irradiatisoli TaxID=2202254 RepID=A0A2Z3JHL1_9DEIO|nr:XRE family transcriptional regulator [Deinococcus irradiatisoli]
MNAESPRLTQADLALKLGIKQPSVAELLGGRRGRIPQSLIDLLDALDLELVVQPKTSGAPQK